jgi:uncharacterized OsmC-like protein
MNGMDEKELVYYVAKLKEHPTECQVKGALTAEWVGGTRARVYSDSGKQMFIGGDGEFGAMGVALASFLSCELDVITTHATLQGIELERLSIEGSGEFNIAKYLGVAEEPGPGYKSVEYTVRIKAKNATKEQLMNLVRLCETASPVGDTLARPVSLKLNTVIE